jgi:hypothetical protein
MKTITKTFATRGEAEAFQNSLYDLYDVVNLVRAPRFTEAGVYEWSVYA